jgi:hypothetical protein
LWERKRTASTRGSIFVHQIIVSAVKRAEFGSDGVSHTKLRGRWCHIIVLNTHALTEDKCDDPEDRFYEELEQVFDHFPKYHIKILLQDLNVNRGERIFLN